MYIFVHQMMQDYDNSIIPVKQIFRGDTGTLSNLTIITDRRTDKGGYQSKLSIVTADVLFSSSNIASLCTISKEEEEEVNTV